MRKIFTIGFMIVLTFVFTQSAFAEKPANLTDEQYQRLLLLAQTRANQNNDNVDDTQNGVLVTGQDTNVALTGETTNVTAVGETNNVARVGEVNNVNGVNGGARTRSNVNQAQRAANNTGAKLGIGASRNGEARSGEVHHDGEHGGARRR